MIDRLSNQAPLRWYGCAVGILLTVGRANADVPYQERLDADCIDRANAPPGLPNDKRFLIQPSLGAALAGGNTPFLVPRSGVMGALRLEMLTAPGPTDGVVIALQGRTIDTSDAHAYDAMLTVGWSRRRYDIHANDLAIGNCTANRQDFHLVEGGLWFSSARGLSPDVDKWLGGVVRLFSYSYRGRMWGYEAAPTFGVAANLAPALHLDEPKVLVLGSLRLTGYVWRLALTLEARLTKHELDGSLALGCPLEI